MTAPPARLLAAAVAIALFLTCCSTNQPPAARDRPLKIVVLGDSLAAGFGLFWGASLPERLERVLKDKGISVSVANAGLSGDTASDGLSRLEMSVPEGTDAVMIELGANDAERGIDPNETKAALGSILRWLQERQIVVLLTGFRAPLSMGPPYVRAFAAIYPSLASAYSFVWYPDILDGVAGNSTLIQIDGEHPNAAGVDVIIERMLPKVEELVARARAARRQ